MIQRLTGSQLHYLLCFRELMEEGPVRTTDLSRYMGLSMPSVHRMLHTLTGLGMVCKTDGVLSLTEAGSESLAYYIRCLSAIDTVMKQTGIPLPATDCRVMATGLSPDTLDRILERYETQRLEE